MATHAASPLNLNASLAVKRWDVGVVDKVCRRWRGWRTWQTDGPVGFAMAMHEALPFNLNGSLDVRRWVVEKVT